MTARPSTSAEPSAPPPTPSPAPPLPPERRIDLSGRTILVVGGAGYIGAHVCKAVAEAGGVPVTLDNLSGGHADAVRWGPLVEADLCDAAATRAACGAHADAWAVVHLASSIEVGRGERDPAGFYRNNVLGAFNLLEGMRAAGLGRLVFSSTCATYGEGHAMPLTEDTPQTPTSVYGRTKLAVEHMIRSYGAAYGLAYVTLRYFNASGADASGGIGEAHDPETHLIPTALEAAAGRRTANGGRMSVFGTDYPTPDGTCVRDYIHVSDIAEAHLDAFRAFGRGVEAAEVNIGTGRGLSNLQILDAVASVTGRPVPYDAAPRRPGDLSALYADATRAREVLGFAPRHSGIETIVGSAWNYHRRVWGEGGAEGGGQRVEAGAASRAGSPPPHR